MSTVIIMTVQLWSNTRQPNIVPAIPGPE